MLPWRDVTAKDKIEIDMLTSANYESMLVAVEQSETYLQIRDLWSAGDTARCHTTPHHGTYDVGRHSYGAVTLLYLLYPGTPRHELVQAVLWHDAAESFLGDLRGDAKWENQDMANGYEAAENRVLHRWFPKAHAALSAITSDEQAWLRAVDALDLLQWTNSQLELGNKHATAINLRVLHNLRRPGNYVPPEVLTYIGENIKETK